MHALAKGAARASGLICAALFGVKKVRGKKGVSVWIGEVGIESGREIRAGKHHAEARATKKRFLTPYLFPFFSPREDKARRGVRGMR
jgi:hypothetical protein